MQHSHPRVERPAGVDALARNSALAAKTPRAALGWAACAPAVTEPRRREECRRAAHS
jgi:hypothetical protein